MTEDSTQVIVFGDTADRHSLESRAPIFERFLGNHDQIEVECTTDNTLFTEGVDKSEKAFAPMTEYDVLILYHPSLRTLWTWNVRQLAYLEEFVQNGGGLVAMHATLAILENDPNHQRLADLVGGGIIAHGPLVDDVRFEVDKPDHPIMEGVESFALQDEPYKLWCNSDVTTLARIFHETIDESPAIWTKPYGHGRVCYYSSGHGSGALTNPNFQRLLTNAVLWTAE
jgi:type 1 glutamine amidotransferase